MDLLLFGAISIGRSSQSVSAAVVTRYDSDWFNDKAHGACQNITLGATGDTVSGRIVSKWWDSSYAHWPNGFTKDKLWHYNVGNYGYAKGTYTIYSSLVTQWTSIAFQSQSYTITIVF